MTDEKGWIKLYRELKNKAIWTGSNSEQRDVLITILMNVNWDVTEFDLLGKKLIVEPGQWVTSVEKIRKLTGGASTQNVRTALKRFEDYEFLTSTSTNHGTVISIVNWGKYQGREDEANKHSNKALTNTSQTPNKPIKKEVKEREEYKERKRRTLKSTQSNISINNKEKALKNTQPNISI